MSFNAVDDFKGETSIFIWDKMFTGDVGHTAIKIDDFIFGYYPTDMDQNGVYDKNDLKNSTGDMHIDHNSVFRQKYINNSIAYYDLNISQTQAQKLVENLVEVRKNPGIYSLTGDHCTTVASNCLSKAGIKFKDNPNFSGSYAVPGLPPSLFQSIIELRANKNLIKNHGTFYVK